MASTVGDARGLLGTGALCALVALSSVACSGDPAAADDEPSPLPPPDCSAAQTLPPGDHEFTIASANGLTYGYTLVIPPTVVAGKGAPLVVIWHGLGSNPAETRRLTHIDDTLASRAMISVHPRSPDTAWDAGNCCTVVRRDETVFVRELLAEVGSRVCVDRRRIYTSGFSNGGTLSQTLACKMADVFAAAAPLSSSLVVTAAECVPSRPIPIFMILGTADPFTPYLLPGPDGIVPGSVEFWAKRNGCTGQPRTVQQGKAALRIYEQCSGNAEAALWSVEGMGHCVPGMVSESAANCLTRSIPFGPPNDDIDGIDLSADFLSRHSLP